MATLRELNGLGAENLNPNGQPGERINVEVDESSPAGPKIKVQQQTWAQGMGWYNQKTVLLNVEQAAELGQALGPALARAKMVRSKPATRPEKPAPKTEGKIIEFPGKRSPRQAEAEKSAEKSPGKVVQFRTRR